MVRQAGFSVEEMLEAGVLVRRSEAIHPRELREAGYTGEQLRLSGYKPNELRRELRISMRELKEAGYTAAALKADGFGPAELREAGFDLASIRRAGFSAAQLHRKGGYVPHVHPYRAPPDALPDRLLMTSDDL